MRNLERRDALSRLHAQSTIGHPKHSHGRLHLFGGNAEKLAVAGMAAAKGSLLLLCVLGCALACAAAAATPSPQPSSSPSPAAGPATSQNAPYVDVPADTSSIIEQLAIRPRIHTQPPRRLLQLTPAADPTGDSTPTSATAALQAQGLAQPPTPRAGLLATAAAALFGAQVAGALISSNSDNWNYRIIGGKPAPPARYKVRASGLSHQHAC